MSNDGTPDDWTTVLGYRHFLMKIRHELLLTFTSGAEDEKALEMRTKMGLQSPVMQHLDRVASRLQAIDHMLKNRVSHKLETGSEREEFANAVGSIGLKPEVLAALEETRTRQRSEEKWKEIQSMLREEYGKAAPAIEGLAKAASVVAVPFVIAGIAAKVLLDTMRGP